MLHAIFAVFLSLLCAFVQFASDDCFLGISRLSTQNHRMGYRIFSLVHGVVAHIRLPVLYDIIQQYPKGLHVRKIDET